MTLQEFLDPDDLGGIDDKMGIYPVKWWICDVEDKGTLRRFVDRCGVNLLRRFDNIMKAAYESDTLSPLRRP